jgi:hypothetical protein
MPDPEMRFSEVRDSVLRDTYATLGIDPNDEAAFTPNVPFLELATTWFNTPPDARGSMTPPTVMRTFGPGREASMVATFDMFGEQFGDNEEANEWLKEQRQVLATQYPEPLHKNRVVSLFDQSIMGGRNRARDAQTGAQPGVQPPAPVAPSPTPGLSIEQEIAADEERRRRLQTDSRR